MSPESMIYLRDSSSIVCPYIPLTFAFWSLASICRSIWSYDQELYPYLWRFSRWRSRDRRDRICGMV